MKTLLHVLRQLAFSLLAAAPIAGLFAQCTNTTEYPFGVTTVPDPLGAGTEITTCSFLQEYSVVGPAIAGASYKFTCTGGAYITVHEGSSDGPVIGNGYSPLTVTATGNDLLYPTWNADDQCNTQSGICQTDSVQLLLDCTPPSATITTVDDCDNNQFSLTVNVTNLGDGTSVDIIHNVNGGLNDTLFDQPVGSYILGPFTVGDLVDVTVAHSSDYMCNLHFNDQQAGLCPTLVACGDSALNYTYCYTDNDNHAWHWQNTTPGMPLSIVFSQGFVDYFYGSFGDQFVIYDGADANAPVLFTPPLYNSYDLTGLQVTSTGSDLYMQIISDEYGSCSSLGYQSWAWTVGCYDCTPATATFNVVTDCANYQYTVDVDITSLGSDSSVDIMNSIDTTVTTVSDTGTYTVGPFTANTPVDLTLVNSVNSLCNVHSGPLVNPVCPVPILCGDPAQEYTFCYHNYMDTTMVYQGNGSYAIALLYNAGQMESCCDNITIYDGLDATAPILYTGNNNGQSMAGIMAISTNPDHALTLVFHSDVSVNCGDQGWPQQDWTVGCLDCVAPVATYTVNTDCVAQTFTIDVDLSVLGSDTLLNITNNAGAAMVTATDTGVYTVGPFALEIPVTLTLTNDSNSLCTVQSPVLVNPVCPTDVTCGDTALAYTYCYGNNEVHAWHWHNTTPGTPLSMIFTAGYVDYFYQTFGDHFVIYDGANNQAPVLFEPPLYNSYDLTGLQVISTGTDIYMEITSDEYGSCADYGYQAWAWTVGCYDCTPPTATYTVVTDCDSMQYNVQVDITTMGSDPVIDITNDNGVPPMPASAAGTYSVGPFPAGTHTTVTLASDVNSLCTVHSLALVNPLCPTVLACGADPITETYCYTNQDNHAWHWQCGCGSPLSLNFISGMIESNFWDQLTIYDGPDNNSPILFQHGTDTEDLSTVQVISSGPDIYMEMSSDFSNSCADGFVGTLWTWTVGCLDCTNPEATFSVIPDCQHATYQVAVNVSNTGSSDSVRIANSASLDTLVDIPAGITLVGPITMDSVSTITVLNATNGLCKVVSPEQSSSFADCIVPINGAQNFTYCYTNIDTSYFAYTCTSGLPVAITFQSGQLLVNDYVQIYDSAGVSPNVLLFQGNYNGNMAGHSFNSTNPENTLVMRVVSDGTYSCTSGDATIPLNWTVDCGYAGIEEQGMGNFTMYPNPATRELYMRLPGDTHGSTEIRILDVSGRIVYRNTFTATGAELNTFDLHGLQSGNYSVVVTAPDWVKAQNLQIIH